MQWTDRIRQVKVFLVIAAIVIAGASLVTSHFLVRDLAEEERGKMEVWAAAMHALNTADETTDLNLVLKVLDDNNMIPVIVTDETGQVQTFRNVTLDAENAEDSLALAAQLAKKWKEDGRVIRIALDNSSDEEDAYKGDGIETSKGVGTEAHEGVGAEAHEGVGAGAEDIVGVGAEAHEGVGAGNLADVGTETINGSDGLKEKATDGESFIEVAYDQSLMLVRLEYYPFAQLGIVLVFVVIAIFALLTSKKAEQNKVWVGLSKETAHQLGTPISSLMAWTEILRSNYPDDELIPEMDKDVKRLQLIAERFSKIGSVPEPVDTVLADLLHHVMDYMRHRTSQKVKLIDQYSDCDARVMVNASLFEWVFENLCKNAVDAMGGEGTITVSAKTEQYKVIIDVTDTGKGIEKKDIKNVFRPGFTTKKRGWGLGLSLAKRIVEEYHKGKIFVLNSEVGVGTTFRVVLPM